MSLLELLIDFPDFQIQIADDCLEFLGLALVSLGAYENKLPAEARNFVVEMKLFLGKMILLHQ